MITPFLETSRRVRRFGLRVLRAVPRFRSRDYRAALFRSAAIRGRHSLYRIVGPAWMRLANHVQRLRVRWEIRFNPPRVPSFDSVRVSIIVPHSSKSGRTRACLGSIIRNTEGITYELIAVKDGASKEAEKWLRSIEGITVLENPRQLGFTACCDRGAEKARGEYLVFLDSDASVTPGWLDALLETTRQLPRTGLVGPKLVSSNGRPKEAAAVVWDDVRNGRDGKKKYDPDHPRNNFAREVDSCPPVCMMIPRELFRQLGGFDSHSLPSDHEGASLAFKVRHAGHKVIYQPTVTVIHDTRRGREWAQTTQTPQYRVQVLVIDHSLPTPDLDSGSLRMLEIVKAIRRRGHHVAFLAEGLAHRQPYAQNMQRLGVEVVHQPFYRSVIDYLDQHGREFDLVIVSRADIASRYLETVRSLAPQAKAVFDTVDLCFLREARAAVILDDPSLCPAAERRKQQELGLAKKYDATMVVSPIEKGILEAECPGIKVILLPNIMDIPSIEPPGFDARRDLVFIGGFGHPPNVDAVVYFVERILPRIVEKLPDVVFQIVGSNMPAEIRRLTGEHVRALGYVPDVRPIFDKSRVAVAPIRFGAGVKGKVNQSMAHGVPTVVSTIAAEGMHLAHELNAMIADDPAGFADAVVRLYTCQDLWDRISANGRENVREHFSVESVSPQIDELLAFAGLAGTLVQPVFRR